MDGFDYSHEAVGMKYYDTNNQRGIPIDGVPDEVNIVPVPADELSYENCWSFVTGPQGSMLTVNHTHTNIEDLQSYAFYRDEAPADMPPYQGDDSYYGISGTVIVGVSCVESFCPAIMKVSARSIISNPRLRQSRQCASSRIYIRLSTSN